MKLNESALKVESIRFKSSDQKQPVAGYFFTRPEITPTAILQISHGMAEHILRYQPLAEYLTANGFVVCGNDHLGHGATSGSDYQNGFFAPEHGRDYVLADLFQMNQLAHERYPDLPLVFLGHSMGSFFARWFLEKYPSAVDAVIICGTGGSNPIGGVGVAITAMLTQLKGATYVSSFVDKLAFGSYCKRIPNANTKSDWLSANPDNVKRYLADPKCGFPFTVSAFHELMVVLQHVNHPSWFTALPKDMPIYLIAGEEDPVGNYGAGVQEVAQRLREAGMHNVMLQLYPEMRHEIFNETDAEQVYHNLLTWCQNVLD